MSFKIDCNSITLTTVESEPILSKGGIQNLAEESLNQVFDLTGVLPQVGDHIDNSTLEEAFEFRVTKRLFDVTASTVWYDLEYKQYRP